MSRRIALASLHPSICRLPYANENRWACDVTRLLDKVNVIRWSRHWTGSPFHLLKCVRRAAYSTGRRIVLRPRPASGTAPSEILRRDGACLTRLHSQKFALRLKRPGSNSRMEDGRG